ncbi:MAG: membrane integrity-associated transporter subunit PqiC [Tatlockia sp.]|nr:membrane integrity-associated transporter subunit PqiC [Tatlockia sp.]
MIDKIVILVLVGFSLFFAACSPVKTLVSNQYKLDSFSNRQLGHASAKQSILITQPEAAAGYQGSEMLYVKKPFELSSFANNAWVDQPANMLLPVIVQSLQASGYFFAVTSSANSEHTDYRLDTQLIELEQNFLKKPSQIDMVVKVVLTHVSDNRVVASRLFGVHISCPMDTPYGGVIAANRATNVLTARISEFAVSLIEKDSKTCVKNSSKSTLPSKNLGFMTK